MEYYIMVKVIKVVNLATHEELLASPRGPFNGDPKEEVNDVVNDDVTNDVTSADDAVNNVVTNVVNNVVEEVVKPTEATKETKTKKPAATGKCDHCGKEMLMKTLKYSHMKLCMPPPPPPPPPSVEKPKPKRSPPKPKPKVVVATEPEVVSRETKPTFDGVVDLSDKKRIVSHEEQYNLMRQERLQQKQHRVKSLISQAI